MVNKDFQNKQFETCRRDIDVIRFRSAWQMGWRGDVALHKAAAAAEACGKDFSRRERDDIFSRRRSDVRSNACRGGWVIDAFPRRRLAHGRLIDRRGGHLPCRRLASPPALATSSSSSSSVLVSSPLSSSKVTRCKSSLVASSSLSLARGGGVVVAPRRARNHPRRPLARPPGYHQPYSF